MTNQPGDIGEQLQSQVPSPFTYMSESPSCVLCLLGGSTFDVILAGEETHEEWVNQVIWNYSTGNGALLTVTNSLSTQDQGTSAVLPWTPELLPISPSPRSSPLPVDGGGGSADIAGSGGDDDSEWLSFFGDFEMLDGGVTTLDDIGDRGGLQGLEERGLEDDAERRREGLSADSIGLSPGTRGSGRADGAVTAKTSRARAVSVVFVVVLWWCRWWG